MKKLCAVEGCDRNARTRGWCPLHYERWRRHGSELWVPPTVPAMERFLSFIAPNESGCWEWTGHLTNGYGRFWFEGATPAAHRWAYERWVGPIPDDLEVDHLCKNRACVNPDHLEAVTGEENIRRSDAWSAVNARKSHCPKGHLYDGVERSTGTRKCLACARENARRYRQRKKEAEAQGVHTVTCPTCKGRCTFTFDAEYEATYRCALASGHPGFHNSLGTHPVRWGDDTLGRASNQCTTCSGTGTVTVRVTAEVVPP